MLVRKIVSLKPNNVYTQLNVDILHNFLHKKSKDTHSWPRGFFMLNSIEHESFILGLSKPEKSWISWFFYTYDHLKFHARLSWAWKNITSGPGHAQQAAPIVWTMRDVKKFLGITIRNLYCGFANIHSTEQQSTNFGNLPSISWQFTSSPMSALYLWPIITFADSNILLLFLLLRHPCKMMMYTNINLFEFRIKSK